MSAAPEWRPPHAYIPGQTPRHADGLFDRFEFDVDDIEGSERWALALGFLRDGFFWEAHEALEPIWMALPGASAERRVTQGLIQLANAGLKRRMARPRAVARLEEMARDLLSHGRNSAGQAILGLDEAQLDSLWQAALSERFTS